MSSNDSNNHLQTISNNLEINNYTKMSSNDVNSNHTVVSSDDQNGPLDLDFLTPDERDAILAVLARDENLQRKEEERLDQLKREIRELRAQEFSRISFDASKICGRCLQEFGWLFNRGQVCSKCRLRVCKKCRQLLNSRTWLCLVCLKVLELESQTGNWFYSRYPKNKKNKSSSQVVTAIDILRISLGDNQSSDPGSKKDEGTVVTEKQEGEEEQPVVLRLTSKNYEPKSPNSFPVSASGMRYQGMMMEMIANRDPQSLQNPVLDTSDKSVESEEAEMRDDKTKKKKSTSNLVTSFSSSVESLMSIYSGAGEVHYGKVLVSGEVELNCRYDDKEERLDIEVVQCRDLGIVDFAKKTSNPYVKCYLLPEKKRQSKRKSTIKKHTLNPVFNATFQWNISRESMPLHSVYLMVWHSGKLGKNDFLGEIVIPLVDEQLQQLNTTQWLPLKPRSTSRPSNLLYYGDIVLSLKFVSRDSLQMKQLSTKSKGELQVLIKHARNLSTDKSSKLNGCFCKAMLLQDNIRGIRQKSAKVEAKNNNPQWNHTFVFADVTRSHLNESSLELTFWDREHSSSDFLGGVRLNAGAGIVSGKRVEWMDAKGEEVLLWQAMLDRPDTWIDGTLMLRSNMVSRK